MTVSELIALLQTMPPDALVIRTCYSDYDDVEPEQITLMEPKDGEGIIRHHGHLMYLRKDWWPQYSLDHGKRPDNPQLLTCVHFDGN